MLKFFVGIRIGIQNEPKKNPNVSMIVFLYLYLLLKNLTKENQHWDHTQLFVSGNLVSTSLCQIEFCHYADPVTNEALTGEIPSKEHFLTKL